MIKCPKCNSTDIKFTDFRFTSKAVFSTAQAVCKKCSYSWWQKPEIKIKINKLENFAEHKVKDILNSKCPRCNRNNFRIHFYRLTTKGKLVVYIKCKCGHFEKYEHQIKHPEKFLTFLYHAMNGTIKQKEVNNKQENDSKFTTSIRLMELYKIIKTYLDGIEIKLFEVSLSILEMQETFKNMLKTIKKLEMLKNILSTLIMHNFEVNYETTDENKIKVQVKDDSLKITVILPSKIVLTAKRSAQDKVDVIYLLSFAQNIQNINAEHQRKIIKNLTNQIKIESKFFDLLNEIIK